MKMKERERAVNRRKIEREKTLWQAESQRDAYFLVTSIRSYNQDL